MKICDRKLTRQIAFCVVAAAILFTKTVSSVAALISIDDPVFGQASVTADTATGLEWLDLTQTTNLSHLQMTALLASDVRFRGWRYATGSEVESLFTDAGISPLLCCSTENVAVVTTLQALLGVTVIGPAFPPTPLTLIGSEFELQQLSQRLPPRRLVLVADRTTERTVLEKAFGPDLAEVRLVEIKSSRDYESVFQALLTAAA